MKNTPDSLSVVLPVRNDPSALIRRVDELLEILPDMAPRFEILILDNGSTDQTEEIAMEFAREFPQIEAIRQPYRSSDEELIEVAVANTTGDLMVIYGEGTRISLAKLREMWALRQDHEMVIARQEEALSPDSLVERLKKWAADLPDPEPTPANRDALQVLRRPAILDIAIQDPVNV